LFAVPTLAYFTHSLFCVLFAFATKKHEIYNSTCDREVNTYKNCMATALMQGAPDENNSTNPLAPPQIKKRLQEM
jgi:hypothetical protein